MSAMVEATNFLRFAAKQNALNRWVPDLRVSGCMPGLAIFLLLALCALPVMAADITVRVSGVKNTNGKVAIAVFSSAEGFPKDDSRAVHKAMASIDKATHSAKAAFAGLKPGEYAVAVFHDDNGSGKLETNFFGMPTKGYGFSNNASPKMRAPTFEEARFTLTPGGADVVITLKY